MFRFGEQRKSKKRNKISSMELPPSLSGNKAQSVSELTGRKLLTEYAFLVLVAGAIMSIVTITVEHAIAAAISGFASIF